MRIVLVAGCGGGPRYMGCGMNQITHALESAGLWPPGEAPDAMPDCAADPDCLPALCEAWHRAELRNSSDHERAIATASRLEQLSASGAALTFGIPGSDPSAVADWIGQRLAFWPEGMPAQRRVGLLSSHLGHGLETRTAWFTALRAACTKVNASDDLLVTTATVTADRFIRRCHELFGIRLLDVTLPASDTSSLRQWGESVLRARHGAPTPGVTRVMLSPEWDDARIPDPSDPDDPIADRTVVALSQRLFVLSLKPRGRLLPLIRKRLGQKNWPIASVTLALGTGLVEKKIAEPLLDDGAVGWVLLDTLPAVRRSDGATSVEAVKPRREQVVRSLETAPIIPVPSAERWRFLTHCTRRIDGPWPDQPEDEYFDDLILERESSDHSPLAVLKRMLENRRIIASSAAIRGAIPVVSFTAVPLANVPQMRVFRPHRSRWDFEPYGICIARDWLENRGARPVIYGDEQTWQSLAEEDRAFFQVSATMSSDDTVRIDWTEENEWRHIGDVDLTSVPADAVLVFVPNEQAAAVLAEKSPWPLVVLADNLPGSVC